jgi:hypothetical protein
MQSFRIPLVTLFIGLLCACGGGGGSDAPGGGGGASAPPVLTAQPESQSATVSSTATFSVAASGVDLSYQWQRSTDGAVSWTNLTVGSSASYSIPAVEASMNGHQFRVIVRSGAFDVTSSAATLTVSLPALPAISVQPAPATSLAGGSAAFSVTASGTNLSYRWQGANGTGWSDLVPGSATATLSLSGLAVSDSGRQFRVIVSNAGGSVTSEVATLTVTPIGVAPTLLAQPQDINVVTGQTAAFVVIVGGGEPAPALRWQLSTNGGATWTDIAGATDASYVTPSTVATDSVSQRRLADKFSPGRADWHITMTMTGVFA